MKVILSFLSSCLSCSIVCLTFSSAKAQENLVPNPSFEIATTSCDREVWGQYQGAEGWDSYRGSTDYMSACNKWDWTYFMGPQYASTGGAFAGLYVYYEGTRHLKDQREFLGTKLLSPLIKGKKYFVSVKFSLAERYPDLACNNLGVLFLTKKHLSTVYNNDPCSTCLDYFPNYAHVYSREIIKEYKNWAEVSGYFVADSSYTHIAIGNFFNDKLTSTERVFPNSLGYHVSYYYVDDVYVVDTGICEMPDCEVVLDMPNIFTPNDDGKNDLFMPIRVNAIESMRTTIYNRWGERLFATEKPTIEWDGNEAAVGVYYWVVDYVDISGNKFQSKGWLSLVR